MASVNKRPVSEPVLTHGGSRAARHLTPIQHWIYELEQQDLGA